MDGEGWIHCIYIRFGEAVYDIEEVMTLWYTAITRMLSFKSDSMTTDNPLIMA